MYMCVVWAGVAGICAVQLVIVGFLVHAFSEGNDDGEKKKD